MSISTFVTKRKLNLWERWPPCPHHPPRQLAALVYLCMSSRWLFGFPVRLGAICSTEGRSFLHRRCIVTFFTLARCLFSDACCPWRRGRLYNSGAEGPFQPVFAFLHKIQWKAFPPLFGVTLFLFFFFVLWAWPWSGVWNVNINTSQVCLLLTVLGVFSMPERMLGVFSGAPWPV